MIFNFIIISFKAHHKLYGCHEWDRLFWYGIINLARAQISQGANISCFLIPARKMGWGVDLLRSSGTGVKVCRSVRNVRVGNFSGLHFPWLFGLGAGVSGCGRGVLFGWPTGCWPSGSSVSGIFSRYPKSLSCLATRGVTCPFTFRL